MGSMDGVVRVMDTLRMPPSITKDLPVGHMNTLTAMNYSEDKVIYQKIVNFEARMIWILFCRLPVVGWAERFRAGSFPNWALCLIKRRVISMGME